MISVYADEEQFDEEGTAVPCPTLRMSRGAGARDNTISDLTVNWDQLINLTKSPISTGRLTVKQSLEAQKPVRAADKDGLWFIPAVFSPPRRAADNVQEICAFVCDFDSGVITASRIIESLQGLQYVAYTSYSHAPGLPYTDPENGQPAEGKEKLRVVIPYVAPIKKSVGLDPENAMQLLADQHRAVYKFFNALFDGQLDTRCETVSQLWFLPRCPSDGAVLYRQFIGEGELFNPEVAFRAAAPDKNDRVPAQSTNANAQGQSMVPGNGAAVAEAERMLAVLDLSMRTTWLKTAMAMKAEFGDEGFAPWHARAAQCKSYVDEADCRRNWDSLKKTGKTTFGTLRWLAQQAGWKPRPSVGNPSPPAVPSTDELASALAYLNPNSAEARAQVAEWLKGARGDEGLAIWTNWAQTGAGFDPETDRILWDYAVPSAVDLSPLYDAAAARGWKPAPPPPPVEIGELNARYFVAKHGRKTYIWAKVHNTVTDQEEFVPTDKESFNLDLMNRKIPRVNPSGETSLIPLAKHWLEHLQRREYPGGVVFAPEGARPDQYNKWEGFSVEPTPGDWSRLKRHIFEVVCSKKPEHYKYLIRWMAWAVQNPGAVAEVAIVMRGDERTGKGTVAKVMTDLFGKHAFTSAQSSQLTGKFNGHLANIALLYVDEALWGGDKASEGVLKQMLTEPTLPVEYKGIDVALARNHLKVMITSNNDWVVPMSEGAARFFVLEVPNTKKGDSTWFKPIHEQLDAGGRAGMLWDLLNMKLKNFDIKRIPSTSGNSHQKQQSMDTVDKWWLQKLLDEEFDVWGYDSTLHINFAWKWGDPMQAKLVYADYCRSVKNGYGRAVSQSAFGVWIANKARGTRVRTAPNPCGGRTWCYTFPPLQDLRADFEKRFGRIDWGTGAVA